MAERTFTKEVQKLLSRRRRGLSRGGDPRSHQGAPAVRGVVRRRVSGCAHLAPDGCPHRRQRHPRGAGRPLRAQRVRGNGRGHARRIGQLPAARRGDVQVDRRHQRRLRRSRQSRVGWRHGRRAHHCRRRLRRWLEHHAGAVARVRDEVADVAPGPAPQSAFDRACRGGGVRALGSDQYTRHARASHSRVPRARPFHAKDNVRPTFTLKDAMEHPRAGCHPHRLPPASFLHEQEKIRKRWPAAQQFIQDHALNEVFADGRQDFGIIMQGGMYNTTIRSLELLGLANAFGDTEVPLYVLNVTYPLVDDGNQAVLRGQARGAGDRGRPARFHRAEPARDSAEGRHSTPRSTARTCSRWPANTPRPSVMTGSTSS